MPYFHTRTVPIMESNTEGQSRESYTPPQAERDSLGATTPTRIRVKNRRKRYLDVHPDYFSASLELADPLLYDRLVRRFQTPAEREAEGREKGYSGVLEADLLRSEAKLDALANPDPHALFTYRRGEDGEIIAEDTEDVPQNKEEGWRRWRDEMEMRFLRGEDEDFDYKSVDENEEYDDRAEEEREAHEKYFGEEEPSWILEEGGTPEGETGVQDF
ncbi:hypothetical protein EJ06DRAFT_532452 [Trichodelitschia bisporula]|uniref:CCD97-like C-terminal domain-containing protein n=1 Tax=Trichodelitschia bisporula TaxID=703511 RepID=A0A6G1HPV3_9PEZI|nr:hypothetical protein EJ06DRAFT_532452 [Trichodelitschia bisporula]